MKTGNSFTRYINRMSRNEFTDIYASINPDEWFSENEMKRFSSPGCLGSLACRYVIKKAIADHINEYSYLREIEILNEKSGRPVISLGENMIRMLERYGIKKIECSISHSRNYFMGLVIICF
jgi:phosphopantetheinyl transferase (holo-ACP synthase)